MLSLFAVHTHRLNKLAMSATTNSMTILKPDLSPLAPKARQKMTWLWRSLTSYYLVGVTPTDVV